MAKRTMDLAAPIDLSVDRNDTNEEVTGTIIMTRCCFKQGGKFWPVFVPDSRIHTVWELFGLFFIIYELISLPYRLVFDVSGGSGLMMIDEIGIYYFMVDVVKCFNTAYYQEGILVSTPRRIIRNYLKSWFLPDLIATVPWQWIFPSDSGGGRSARMLRILRFGRFLRLARLLKVAKVKRLLRKLEEATDTFFAASFILRMLRVFLWLALLSHFSACAWYIVGKKSPPDSPVEPNSWLDKLDIPEDAEDRTWQLYLNALYFSLATMTTVGYGDIFPCNSGEKLFGIFYFLLSIVAFSGVVGSVGEVLHAFEQVSAAKKNQVSQLKQYMRWRNLPIQLQNRLKHFVYYALDHCDQELADEEDTILQQLSPALRQQVCLHVYGPAFKDLSCLKWLINDPRQQAFQVLLTMVKTELHGPLDLIYVAGQVAEKVYFLKEGVVITMRHKSDVGAMHSHKYIQLMVKCSCGVDPDEVGASDDDEPDSSGNLKEPVSKDISLINAPDHFGQDCLLDLLDGDEQQVRISSAMSQNHCQVHSISVDDVRSLLSRFPFLWEKARASFMRDPTLDPYRKSGSLKGIGPSDVPDDIDCELELDDGDPLQKVRDKIDALMVQYRNLELEHQSMTKNGFVETAVLGRPAESAPKSQVKEKLSKATGDLSAYVRTKSSVFLSGKTWLS